MVNLGKQTRDGDLAKRGLMERQTVQQAMSASKKVQPGQRWYLVNAQWMRQWRKFVRWEDAEGQVKRSQSSSDEQRSESPQSTDHNDDDDDDDDATDDDDVDDFEPPGKIDNSDLVENAHDEWSPLRDGVCEDVDFELVPESVWFFLTSWYTAAPVVCREAIAVGPNQQATVELRPLTLVGVPFALEQLVQLIEKLSLVVRFSSPTTRAMEAALAHFNAADSTTFTVRVSKTCSIGDLCARFAALLKKNKTAIRVHMPPADSDATLRVDAGDGTAATRKAARSSVKSLVYLDDPYASVQGVLLQNGGRVLVEVSSGEDVWPLTPPLPPSRWSALKRTMVRVVKGIAKLGDAPDGGGDAARTHGDGDSDADAAPRLQGGDGGGGTAAADGGDKTTRSGAAAKKAAAAAKKRDGEVDGMCGLKNLGNTCYMNSAVQALSLSTEFRRYFLSERYKPDLNKDNPLGTKGRVAEAFAALLAKLWAGEFRTVSPAQLRMAIGKAESRFDSYQQQDSQELMAFLLDALHEDLNRVRDKPYVEKKEAAGRPDSVVAAEAWSDHTRRNKSAVVDLFQGQLRSELTCPTCNQRSVTFDPFMFLSLPLPTESKCVIEVIVLRYMSHAQQTKYAVTIPKRCRMETVRAAIGQAIGVDPAHIIIATFYRLTISSWLVDGRPADEVLEPNAGTIAFEVPDRTAQQLLRVQVYHRVRELVRGYARDYKDNKLLGVPFVIYFPRQGTTALELYELALQHCERYLRVNVDSSSDDEQTPPPIVSDDDDDGGGGEGDDDNSSGGGHDDKAGDEDEAAGDAKAAPAPSAATTAAAGDDGDASTFDSARSESAVPTAAAAPAGKAAKSAAATRFPFVLKFVTKDGLSCSHCSRVTCSGCVLEPDDTVLPFEKPGSFLAADWKLRELHKHYKRSAISSVTLDTSVQEARDARKQPQISLASCFASFAAPERLSAQDEWYCSRCTQHVRANKMLTLWKLPPLLIVHLKRFSYGSSLVSRQKLQHQVECPTDDLDLAPFVLGADGDAAGTYRLYAVINHVGGIGGGHYYAYGRGCDPANADQWYEFNDSSVTPHKGAVVTREAYILLYERVAPAPGSLVLDAPLPVTTGASSASSGKKRVKKRTNGSSGKADTATDSEPTTSEPSGGGAPPAAP